MIIYPILILLILLIGFLIVWRRANILEEKGMLEREISVAKRDKHYFSFWSKKENEKKENLVSDKVSDEENIDDNSAGGDKEVSIEKEIDPSFAKAEELFKKKQYISAEKWYLEAVKADPKNADIYARLGIIYIEQKNYKDSLEALEESVKLAPNVAGRFFNLSFVYNTNGDKKNAILNAKKALRLDSQNEKYRDWLEHLKSSPF